MTISRGQMNRQLYRGGGIMGLSKEGIGGGDYKGYDMGSRVGFGILKKFTGGVKKAVKGVTGAVKDIASSDIGKAALLVGGGMYAGGLGPFAGIKGAGFASNLIPSSFNPIEMFGKKKIKDFLTSGAGIATVGGGLASLFAGLSAADQADIDEADIDERADVVAEKLRQSLTRLGYSGKILEDKVAEGVSEYTGYTSKAEGGRIGYAEAGSAIKDPYDVIEEMDNELNPGIIDKLPFVGAGKYSLNKDQGASLIEEIQDYKYGQPSGSFNSSGKIPEQAPMSMEETIAILEDKWDQAVEEGYGLGKFDDLGIYKKEDIRRRIELGFDQAKAIGDPLPPDPTAPVNPFGPKPIGPVLPNKMMAAQGGIMNRMNYALGDTASQNAMQAAGIEGLPMRQNPKGVQELDLRDKGGFIPPVGIKEKEDDIPAMLSNNEFVFTADAVRGMGDGDVELGAQRMYDQMKMLEKGGRV